MITKLYAFLHLLQALQEEWSHCQQLCEAALACYSSTKIGAVIEFLQFAQNASGTQQPYSSLKIFHIAQTAKNMPDISDRRRFTVLVSCCNHKSSEKSAQISSIILRMRATEIYPAIFFYLKYTHFDKAIPQRHSRYLRHALCGRPVGGHPRTSC